MKKGDIYDKHVRGSRYVYNIDGIYYKVRDIKIPTTTDVSKIIEDIIDVRKENSGRIIINEEREIITYIRKKKNEWLPVYVGQLNKELVFEDIEINPKNLEIGSLWAGFLRKHGSKYKFSREGRIYFLEKIQSNTKSSSITYYVQNFNNSFLKRICQLRGRMQNSYNWLNAGSIWINEYGHMWTAITKDRMKYLIKKDVLKKEIIDQQWRKLSNLQKNLLNEYTKPQKDRRNKDKEISWYPIYLGKYEHQIQIDRPREPKIIYSVDDNYDRWFD